MTNIQTELGEPLPASTHAVSVSLPKWADVVGYEEGDARVVNAMKTGYPRFVYNKITKKLFEAAEKKFASENEFCLVFPSERIANLGLKFCGAGRVEKFSDSIYALVLPKGSEKEAKAFWQHPGYIVSSRQAEAVLAGTAGENGDEAKQKIKATLSKLTTEKPENIYLYPSGMAAIFNAFEVTSEGATVQLGFPYVDTLKIQQKFGRETIFLDYKSHDDLDKLEKLAQEKKISAVFTEFPCNPLITCVDLEKLSGICRKNKIALVVDDTLSTWANIDLSPYADITVSSLTKFFSGIGDVLAGSLVLNSKSPLFKDLKTKLDGFYEDLLFGEDAIILEKNSRDFEDRIKQINTTAEKLADWLKTKTTVYYTKGNPVFEKHKKLGYGGIISLVLDTPEQAQKFFDVLHVNKGPSLGTNYTLACPYTLLAHYYEREFAENAGVPFHLIRISVGLESFEELKATFEAAFKAI